MSAYHPPVKDMHFLLTRVLGFRHDALDSETVEAILGEAAKLAADVLAPLNQPGDKTGAKLKDGTVTMPPGFKEAYRQYREGGWNAVPFEEEYGGQGLPFAIAFPVQEMWQAANMSFGLCPLLNQGAVDALSSHGSEELKKYYLPKMIAGEWTGTMNLTEPQAGSDLGLLRAKAEKQKDGSYKITGQKIFITYGEHDMAENIIHLTLARATDAPEDVKGISLFIVPKFLKDGTRNTVKCIGIEHKLGIHASPTCTMEFSNAIGYLVGKENEGLKGMFTMMNNARLSVGLQGVSIGERAYQAAANFAAERLQGKSFETGRRVNIREHSDVKRMLLTMKSQVEAGRALTYDAALALDAARHGDAAAQAKVDVMTPIVKAWCSEMACQVTSIGVQVHGGMGFVEETGVAQYYRDARILPIYEGTNGIQAADLAFRKVLRDGGAAAGTYIAWLESIIAADERLLFQNLFAELKTATSFLIAEGKKNNMNLVAAAAWPYLNAFGYIAAGAMISLAAQKAASLEDKEFTQEKIKTAKFYLHNVLPQAHGWLRATVYGAAYV